MARLAGLEPTASASAGLRSIQLSYKRFLVPKVGFEPTCPCGHYALNVARLPFRHFGIICRLYWWPIAVSTNDLALTSCLKRSKITVGDIKMPIYEYICLRCKSRFELLRPMSQAGKGVACPHCGSQADRALSSFACFTKNESGLSSPVGGSSCSGCSTTSCDTCGI